MQARPVAETLANADRLLAAVTLSARAAASEVAALAGGIRDADDGGRLAKLVEEVKALCGEQNALQAAAARAVDALPMEVLQGLLRGAAPQKARPASPDSAGTHDAERAPPARLHVHNEHLVLMLGAVVGLRSVACEGGRRVPVRATTTDGRVQLTAGAAREARVCLSDNLPRAEGASQLTMTMGELLCKLEVVGDALLQGWAPAFRAEMADTVEYIVERLSA